MQLYSEEKDWNKLVEVVLRLAEFVDDPKQKAKYLHTAAIVTGRQMGDVDRALEFYEQVLALDGTMDKALDEAIELQRDRNEHRAVEPLLKRRLERATEANDEAAMLATFTELGELYEKKLGWINEAIDAYEAAQTLDPDNSERAEHLARALRHRSREVPGQGGRFTAGDPAPESVPPRVVQAPAPALHRGEARRRRVVLVPGAVRPEPGRARRGALLQAHARGHRGARAAGLTDDDWLRLVMHADADPLLTSVFALIEPAVIGAPRTDPRGARLRPALRDRPQHASVPDEPDAALRGRRARHGAAADLSEHRTIPAA